MEVLRDIETLEASLRQADSERVAMLLQRALSEEWDRRVEGALQEAAQAMQQENASVDEVLGILRGRLGEAYGAQMRSVLGEAVELSYAVGQDGVEPGLAFQFNGTDRRALRWLEEHNTYWIGNHFNRQVRGRIKDLGADTIEEGLGRFAAGQKFAESQLGQEFAKSHSYWAGLSNHVTTRSREFGRVETFVKAGVEEVVVDALIDHRTSCICRHLDRIGMTIPVEALTSQRDELMAAEEPEAVKQVSPWLDCDQVKGLGQEQLISRGVILPPYHWHCRTTLQKA